MGAARLARLLPRNHFARSTLRLRVPASSGVGAGVRGGARRAGVAAGIPEGPRGRPAAQLNVRAKTGCPGAEVKTLPGGQGSGGGHWGRSGLWGGCGRPMARGVRGGGVGPQVNAADSVVPA